MNLAETLVEPVSSPIHDALVAGVDVLSQNETVEFTPYVRTVLPIDGYVFWLNANLLPVSKLVQHNLQSPPLEVTVQGSLHYASIGYQDPDQTMVVRQVDFTAETPIEAFGVLSADVMYVATWNTALGPFKFTFSRRNNFYRSAKIYHYVGDAVYPAFDDILIDEVGQFDQRQVVSNSLPIWMSMFANPPFPSLVTIDVPIYPAMLVMENISPPYIVVEINERPELIQTFPVRNLRSSVYQQCSDEVTLITYGLRNDAIMDLRDYILDYSMTTGNIGINRPPVIMDVRRHQIELAALAVKKQIELSINYYQQRARDIAVQLIRHAGVAVYENPHPIPRIVA